MHVDWIVVKPKQNYPHYFRWQTRMSVAVRSFRIYIPTQISSRSCVGSPRNTVTNTSDGREWRGRRLTRIKWDRYVLSGVSSVILIPSFSYSTHFDPTSGSFYFSPLQLASLADFLLCYLFPIIVVVGEDWWVSLWGKSDTWGNG